MAVKQHNPAGVFPPYANYADAVEVPADARTLYVSGATMLDAEPQAVVHSA